MPACTSRCSSWRRRSPTGGWHLAQVRLEEVGDGLSRDGGAVLDTGAL